MRFADAEGHPFVHAVSVDTERELMDTPLEVLTRKEENQNVIATADSFQQRRYSGPKPDFNHADRKSDPQLTYAAGNVGHRETFEDLGSLRYSKITGDQAFVSSISERRRPASGIQIRQAWHTVQQAGFPWFGFHLERDDAECMATVLAVFSMREVACA